MSKSKTLTALYDLLFGYSCFALGFSLLTFSHISQAVESVKVSWVFCENCLSVFCEFFHSMAAVLAQWEPLCFLQGRQA